MNSHGAPPAGKDEAQAQKGKRLSEIDKTKNEATGKVSDVGRQLAFAGIATVWLLRDGGAERPISGLLLKALIVLSIALLIDFLQYVYCSRVWRKFYNEQYEAHQDDDARIDIPDSLANKTYLFFWAKIWFLGLGYVFLLTGATVKLRIF